jgi:hypothetical protein
MRLDICLRRSFLQQSAYDQIAIAIAHELSHIVLDSIKHPLRRCEKAVDLTAMLLGFSRLYSSGSYKEQRLKHGTATQQLGYLSANEVKRANQIISRSQPNRAWELVDRLRASVNQNWHPRLIWHKLATPGNFFLGFALCSAIGIWILGTSSAFQSRLETPPINSATQTMPAVQERQLTTPTAPPSDQIAGVQLRLIQLGYLAGRPDNVWGSRSRRALRAFKAANALLVNDSWDEETNASLFSANAAYAPAPVVSNAKR